jgi:hypothetical protein
VLKTGKMPTATKRKPARKLTLGKLSREMSRLRSRVEELEDLRELNEAIARNKGRPGTPWELAKKELGIA